MKIGDNVIMVDGKGGVIISINDYIEIKRKSLREKVMENIKFRTMKLISFKGVQNDR